MPFFHQLQQLTFTHHRIRKIQPSEFDLLWMVDPQRFAKPIVQRAVVLEFQSANGISNAFDRIALPVRKIVRRIDTPLVGSAMVRGTFDAIHNRVAQIYVRRSHVDLRPQRVRAIGKLAISHLLK